MRISDWSSDVCSSDLLEHAFRPFQENCLYAQRAAHFMANDDAPHGGRHNYIDVGPDFTGNLLRQRPGEAACALRIHQHAGALQIIGAALSRREDKMALQQRLRSEEHTSELQSLMRISYAVFCLKKKK